MDGYAIRTMRRDEFALALDWAAREGWNPGLHDADAFHAADPDGFLLATLGGAPVGCVSAVRYGDAFGFVGFYIVVPERRGQGCGLPLWQAALARLAGRTVGLDGVPAQQDNYRRSGFALAHRNVRYQGMGGAVPPDAPELVAPPGPDALLAYERELFPAPRADFLSAWLALPGACHAAWVERGRLRGYAVARLCRSGWKVGPLFADAAGIADALLSRLAAGVGAGEPLFLDVPEPNGAAVALAVRHGMAPVFETARMYAGPPPVVDLGRVYGITSFELG